MRPLKSFRLLGAIGLAVFGVTEASAMHIRVYEKVLAWSDDGKHALIERAGEGPEGGGSWGVRFAGPKAFAEDYVASSTYSPGDASEPQSITAAACEKTFRRVQSRLKDMGFSSVKVDLKKCRATKGRDAVIVLTKPIPDEDQSDRKRFVRGDWTFIPDRGSLSLQTPARSWTFWDSSLPAMISDVMVSPTRRLVLIFRTPVFSGQPAWDEKTVFTTYLVSSDGSAENLQALIPIE